MHIRNPAHLLQQIYQQIRLRVYPYRSQDTGIRLSTQIGLEGLLAAIVLNLATVFTAMFATRLGAGSSQIGLLSSLPQWAGFVMIIPGTLLAGRLQFSRRPVEISLLSAGLLYGLAGLAPYMGAFRVWYLMGMVALANAPMSLYNTSWQNYFSEVAAPGQRNDLYTQRTSMTFAAGIVVIQATGLILSHSASDSIRILLYQCCYFLAFIVSILQWLVIRQSPDILTESSRSGLKNLREALKNLRSEKRFLAFILISFVFHVGWYMAWPLFFLVQVQYMQANEAWLSYVLVSASLLQWLTVGFWGRFIQRFGVRFAIVIGAIGLTVNPLMAMAASYFPLGWRMPAMLGLNLINAATFSAFQLSLLQCLLEVVPSRHKQLNLSLYTMMLLFSNALMQWLGVRIYIGLGESHAAMSWALIVSAAIRFAGMLGLVIRWLFMRSEPDLGRRFE